MTEQHLNDADVGPGLEQMRRKAVPQGMDCHRLAQVGLTCRLAAGFLQCGYADRFRRILAREQPPTRPNQAPVGAQDLQQLRRQHDVAILAALALLNTDQHPAAVDGSCCQTNDLTDAQPGAISGGQGDPVAEARNSLEEPYDLVTAEHHRQSLRFARGDDLLVGSLRPKVMP